MPEVSRRAVLGTGAAALGLAVLGVGATPADAAAVRIPAPLRSHYAGAVGRRFLAVSGATRRRLTLVAVQDLHPSTRAQRPYCFNLIFTPVSGAAVPEGIYRLQRTGAPTAELFLSPVGAGSHVQALVNRAH